VTPDDLPRWCAGVAEVAPDRWRAWVRGDGPPWWGPHATSHPAALADLDQILAHLRDRCGLRTVALPDPDTEGPE
jgi:hypothetical protein